MAAAENRGFISGESTDFLRRLYLQIGPGANLASCPTGAEGCSPGNLMGS
jgi:hypothetical protein